MKRTSFFFSCFFAGIMASAAWAEPPEGQDVRRDYSPTISPDGEEMAWYGYRGNDNPDIWVADMNGGHQRNITQSETTWDIEPDWSPDGQRIVFARGLSMRRLDLFVAAPDGSDLTQITSGELSESAPSWAPDSRRVAYVSMAPGSDTPFQIEVVDTETGEIDVLVSGDMLGMTGNAYSPAWSPDGRFLAFAFDAAETPNVGADLYLLEIASGAINRLTETNWHEFSPSWSPDSARLYFSSDQSGIARRVHAFDLHGHRDPAAPAAEITAGYGDQYFVTVGPDGRVVFDMRNPLYGAGDPGERDAFLFRTGAEGGHAEQLTAYD